MSKHTVATIFINKKVLGKKRIEIVTIAVTVLLPSTYINK